MVLTPKDEITTRVFISFFQLSFYLAYTQTYTELIHRSDR
ncbi:hypothetical protein VPHK327_0025 [Vibrio phage K327]